MTPAELCPWIASERGRRQTALRALHFVKMVAHPDLATLEAALDNARRFFVGDADVQRAMRELCKNLESLAVPYSIAGAMALNAYGYERVTKDVVVILTREGLTSSPWRRCSSSRSRRG